MKKFTHVSRKCIIRTFLNRKCPDDSFRSNLGRFFDFARIHFCSTECVEHFYV